MKIFFQLSETTEANLFTSLDAIELQVNKTWIRLEVLKTLTKDVVCALLTPTTIGVWISINKLIQGVRYVDTFAVLQSPSFDILSEAQEDDFGDLTLVTVNEFIPGKLYLLPYAAGAVTGIMPQSTISTIEGTVDGLLVPTHYQYQCSERHQVRNGASFSAWVTDLNIKSIAVNENRSANKDITRAVNFVAKASA